jgi:peptide-methionine (S)-S-oxide reductase
MHRAIILSLLLGVLTSGGGTMAATGDPTPRTEQAVLGGGCFWCLEAVFERVAGVKDVTSGYAGGHTDHPTYEEVCTGETGHAEVVRITFDPDVVSYRDLLEIFFGVHDPTTPNRQGDDVGTQYRSIILYDGDEQRRTAEAVLREQAERWPDPVVTELVPLTAFHPAEAYHQDYFRKNPAAGYCRLVVAPKVDKALRRFPQRLR